MSIFGTLGGAFRLTSDPIAASHADPNPLEFSAWLRASYDMEADTLTPGQKEKFEAKFFQVPVHGIERDNGSPAAADE
jgi:hypothetical protein